MVRWGDRYPFSLQPLTERRAGFGIALSGPFNTLRSFRSSTPYAFTPLRYGTSDSQFKGTLSAAIEIVPRVLYFGAGLSLFITSSGNAETTLVTENPTGRFALDVGLNTAAVVGTFVKGDSWQAGVVYRQEVAPQLEQRFAGTVGLGDGDAVIQPLLFRSTLYFEPHTFDAEFQTDLGPLVASVGLSYQLWSRYRPSYLVAQTKNAKGNTLVTEEPGIPFHDTLSPRVSVEVPVWRRQILVGAGYRYRPSPVGDLSGPGNTLGRLIPT